MRRFLAIPLLALVAGVMVPRATRAADDWSFVNGNYALDPDDCNLVGSAAAFSKELVDGLGQEVMTREGITSPREVHCRFRSPEKSDTRWKVQADCEEAGEASPVEIAVTTSSDGTVSILTKDVYGPEALKFTPCQK